MVKRDSGDSKKIQEEGGTHIFIECPRLRGPRSQSFPPGPCVTVPKESYSGLSPMSSSSMSIVNGCSSGVFLQLRDGCQCQRSEEDTRFDHGLHSELRQRNVSTRNDKAIPKSGMANSAGESSTMIYRRARGKEPATAQPPNFCLVDRPLLPPPTPQSTHC